MAKTTPKIPSCQAEGKAEPPPFLPSGADGGSEAPLLYLSCNNSIEVIKKYNQLSPYHKKQASVLCQNSERFINYHGILKTGFLTLTFAENITDHAEAQRRWNSFKTNFLNKYINHWILVKEKQSRGAWHYHILIACPDDIRTGFDFGLYKQISILRHKQQFSVFRPAITAYERALYKSSNPELRKMWKIFSIQNLKKYGFGRPHLAPIETTVEAVGKYVGKYISKHVGAKTEQDKGVRLFACSQGEIQSSTKFQWNGEGSKEWRKNVEKFAALVGCDSLDDLNKKFGSKWAYKLQHYVFAVDTLTPPEIARLRLHQEVEQHYSDATLAYIAAIHTARNPAPLLKNGLLVSPLTGEVFF